MKLLRCLRKGFYKKKTNKMTLKKELKDSNLSSKKYYKSNFKLSKRSLSRLNDVDDDLIKVIIEGLSISRIDYGVLKGKRTLSEQIKLYENGDSQTLDSKHLYGEAVDLVAYIGNNITWELDYYIEIAECIRLIAKKHNIKIRWGGSWVVLNDQVSAKQSIIEYIDRKNKENKDPFIDAGHFEIIKE